MTDTDKKRKAILASEVYKSGRTFLTSEMVALMEKAVGRKLLDREATQTLYAMFRHDPPLLDYYQSSKGINNWYKPLDNQLSTPWRTQSNADLGIIDQAGPVEWARHGA